MCNLDVFIYCLKNLQKELFNSIVSFSFKNILILNEQIALHLILANIHT